MLDLPWNKKSEEPMHDLAEAQAHPRPRTTMALEKVKERIMEFLAVKSLAPEAIKGQVHVSGRPSGCRQDLDCPSPLPEAMGRELHRA